MVKTVNQILIDRKKVMIEYYYEEKTRLMRELKVEMLNQLAVVQAEDPERFLRSTERCHTIIEAINTVDLQKPQLPDNLSLELSRLLRDINKIGQQISHLMPPLQEKLRHQLIAEKKMVVAKHRYKREDFSLPSIFLDKKI